MEARVGDWRQGASWRCISSCGVDDQGERVRCPESRQALRLGCLLSRALHARQVMPLLPAESCGECLGRNAVALSCRRRGKQPGLGLSVDLLGARRDGVALAAQGRRGAAGAAEAGCALVCGKGGQEGPLACQSNVVRGRLAVAWPASNMVSWARGWEALQTYRAVLQHTRVGAGSRQITHRSRRSRSSGCCRCSRRCRRGSCRGSCRAGRGTRPGASACRSGCQERRSSQTGRWQSPCGGWRGGGAALGVSGLEVAC